MSGGELRVRRLEPAARLPVRAHDDDAGYDLCALEAATLAPGERAMLRTGIAIELPAGHAGLVVPRSGLAARHGISVVNAPGLIDAGYRGELKVLLLNTDRTQPFEIAPGDRIAQLVIVAVATPAIAEREELAQTARGEGGFGSSGVGGGAAPSGAATFQRPAEVYDRLVGRYGPALGRALIATAGVEPGRRALDVGCGPGALTGELAALLGADRVAAVEPSAPFAAACRERHPGVHVEVAAAEALPFADGAFDHALAQLVVNFMTDPPAGVAEMRRVTRPGGTVTGAVWDYAGEMTLLRRFWDAAVALDPAAAERDEGRSMPYCTPETLGALWSAAGLGEVAVTEVVVAAGYESFEDLWQPLELGVAPSGAYAAALPPDRRAALKDELRRRLGVGDEPFELTARAWVATGRAG